MYKISSTLKCGVFYYTIRGKKISLELPKDIEKDKLEILLL